jgi:MscS family membrane protein
MEKIVRVMRARALCIATGVLFLGSLTLSPAQLPKSVGQAPTGAASTPAAKTDPLGRETPLGCVMGFSKWAERRDFATAARYVQPFPGEDPSLQEQRAKELQALLHQGYKGNFSLLSNDPDGSIEAGLPPGQTRAGVLAVGDTTVDLILVRVDNPESGKIWLVSKETVASVLVLYAQLQSQAPTTVDRIVPAGLRNRELLGMSLARWLGLLLSIPISWFLAWLSTFPLGAPQRIWYGLRKRPFRPIWDTLLRMPLRCVIAILINSAFLYLIRPPLLYRLYYFRVMAVLLVACFVWLVSRITDDGFAIVANRTRTQRRGGESILILMHRLTHVVMIIVVFIAAAAIFGLNITTTLAGLGIGGLAIALAAQKTLENVIGGVSLLMDKAVQVGDFCQIGDQLGTVEDIGLRSLKLRTLDQNLSVVPNGSLAQMQFLNMSRRSKLLINQKFSLRIETQVCQLQYVLDRVQRMLNEHPRIEVGTSRVRIAGFAGAAFDMELFAYGKTGDWTDFTTIRQDVILKIAEIVEAAGTRLAAPTRLAYFGNNPGVDLETAKGVVSSVGEVQHSDALRLPDKAQS